MQISAISGRHALPRGNDNMAQIMQAFQSLGTALDAGNLSAAKDAYAQLQKNAPAATGTSTANPMQSKVDALGAALDSGDVQAARSAYADITTTLAQRSASTGGSHPAGGPKPGGGPKSGGQVGGASSSNKTYDPKDTNQDGTVSMQEELAFALKQQTDTTQRATAKRGDGGVDALA